MDRSPQDQRRGRHRRKRLSWWFRWLWLQPPPAPVTEETLAQEPQGSTSHSTPTASLGSHGQYRHWQPGTR